MRKSLLVAAAAALLLSSTALAAPGLRVGAVEDAAIWGDAGAQMDLAKLAGFDTVRMTAQWTVGQTALPPAQMARIQHAATAATVRGIQPIVAIYNQGGAATPADEGSRRLFAIFARTVAEQLPWVTTFIVGNEPNSNLYWQPQFDASGGDAAALAYEQLLAAGYDAIKAVRPNATVVGGALDSRGADDPASKRQTHSPTQFIQDLGAAYRASGRTTPIMDVFDEHVYADNSSLPPSMPHIGTAIATGDYRKLVALLGKAFDGTAQKGSTLPILYGEFGVESAVPGEKAFRYSGAEAAKAVDEATQARYYTEALELAYCAPNVIGFLNFHVVDESNLNGFQSGPFYADGLPKSSFQAFHDAIAAAHARTLTSCPDTTAPSVTMQLGDGTVNANASDDVGVGEVQLVVNGSVVAADYTAPYSFTWMRPTSGGYVVQLRALDAAGNIGTATTAVGVRTLSGARGKLASGPGGTFTWRAPKTAPVTFTSGRALRVGKLAGKRVRFNATRGVTYELSVSALPLSWQS
ncbi:MAG: Ig-like domain-containing protein [Chloroflexota bacterium]